jgi:prepilin-type N-terminal cleavage/methylation domain-containing protein
MNRYTYRRPAGFTLIELLISVVLMVILVGVVVVVFVNTSEVMTASEAKMEVYQNARAVFEIMARDMAGIQVSTFRGMGIRQPTVYSTVYSNTSGEYFVGFFTIGSWRQPSGAGSGTAEIEYRLRSTGSAGLGLVNIERALTYTNSVGTLVTTTNLLGQYVNNTGGALRFRIEYYNKDPAFPPVNRFIEPPTTLRFFQTSATVPSAIRISMDLRDRRTKVVRSFSRVIWIATGGN